MQFLALSAFCESTSSKKHEELIYVELVFIYRMLSIETLIILAQGSVMTVFIFFPLRSQLAQIPRFWAKRREWPRIKLGPFTAQSDAPRTVPLLVENQCLLYKISSEWNIIALFHLYINVQVTTVSVHLFPLVCVLSWPFQNLGSFSQLFH